MTSVFCDGSTPSESGYSSSLQMSWRLAVLASSSTAGWPRSNERATSVIGTRPALSKAFWSSIPGTLATISVPGLKPSLRLNSVGTTGTPAALAGMSASWRFSRNPVSVVGSGLV